MIKRVSMWKLIDSSKANEMAALLESLENNVSSLLSSEIGINKSEHRSAYDVVFIGSFESNEKLREFDVDPYHKEIAEIVSGLRADRKFVEFEC